ncbi:MAG: FecR domain-containing protein [Bacteroidia bacterium]
MNLGKYEDYCAEDFARDDRFIRWVVSPSPEEDAFWKEFMAVYPYKESEINSAREMIFLAQQLQPSKQLTKAEKDLMHENILAKIHAETSYAITTTSKTPRFLRYAAVVALLVSCATIFYNYWERNQHQIYETSFGETLTVELPDHSRVILNGHSRLCFSKNWKNNEDRFVWLDGEAFFEVTRQVETQTKFSVMARDMVVQVLGTKFNVNSRKEKTRVVLNEGQIKLMLNDEKANPILMDPGDMVDYDHNDNQLVQTKVNPELHSSWKEGIQLFDKTPLQEVVEKMEEIYGVTISLNNEKLRQRKMTMGIPVEDLEIALRTIESVLGLKITKNSDRNFVIN